MSDKPSNLPPWVVASGTVLIGGLLLFNVVYDALSRAYSNPTLSLMLLGAFSAALGFGKALRGGDEK